LGSRVLSIAIGFALIGLVWFAHGRRDAFTKSLLLLAGIAFLGAGVTGTLSVSALIDAVRWWAR
jgi:hypothetical protein